MGTSLDRVKYDSTAGTVTLDNTPYTWTTGLEVEKDALNKIKTIRINKSASLPSRAIFITQDDSEQTISVNPVGMNATDVREYHFFVDPKDDIDLKGVDQDLVEIIENSGGDGQTLVIKDAGRNHVLTIVVHGLGRDITSNDLNFTRRTPLLAGQIGDGPSATFHLREQDLVAIREEAVSRWTEAAGADPRVAHYLEQLVVTLSDLDGRALATTFNATVRIDIDAAGNGWFVDATPATDGEFARPGPAGSLLADADSEAYAKYDLLTVVMHEIGHVLGLADINQPGGLMNRQLSGGTRAAVAAEDAALITVDAATIGDLNGAGLSDEEKILGGLDAFAQWAKDLGDEVSDAISLPFVDIELDDLWAPRATSLSAASASGSAAKSSASSRTMTRSPRKTCWPWTSSSCHRPICSPNSWPIWN